VVRIVSLVPHATELLFALGLGDQVIAVTHECDYPPAARTLTQVTRDALPPGLSAAQIDAAVRQRTQAGEAIYALDEDVLRELAPELIVTQALCPVCAVSYTEVAELAQTLPSCPEVLALDPETFRETLGDVLTVAAATGHPERGAALGAETEQRIARVRRAVDGLRRPRVAALEWLDPVFVAGHWTPELIELAGGEDVLGLPGRPSTTVPWDDVIAARPEIVVVMPCGYDAPRARQEALLEEHACMLSALGAEKVVAVDASAYFSRPGPRLIEGLELLGHILHPAALPETPGKALALDLTLELELSAEASATTGTDATH
jgi:iron complex transport system substrate-binding protein